MGRAILERATDARLASPTVEANRPERSRDRIPSPLRALPPTGAVRGCRGMAFVRAVVFDLDETLLDRTATIEAWLDRAHAGLLAGSGVTRERFGAAFHALDDHGHGCTDKRELFARLVAELGVDVDPVALFGSFHVDAWREPRCFPGAHDVLRTLRARGLKLGIITNGGMPGQANKIRNAGLDELVDAWLVSSAFGCAKPDPRIFAAMAERLGVAPAGCLMIGDHPRCDVLGARAAGWQAIWTPRWLAWPPDEREPMQVDAVRELPRIVDVLMRCA